jgi:hypothetical protein
MTWITKRLCLLFSSFVVSCLAYFSTARIKAICCPETSVDFQLSTRYVPEDIILRNHCCVTFRSCKCYQVMELCLRDIKLMKKSDVSEHHAASNSKIGQWINQAEVFLLPTSCWFLTWLTFRPWRRMQHTPPIRQLAFNRIHGAVFLRDRC